ncbi:MAG: YcxB family protein [Agathobaculum sp.]|uniref:YcxB family protein n=1 Tax=Agathobaculum sp. TaxID=2048138 RepID=UPI0025C59B68|nr:YcxB family protein [Agathobaculum sp.]MCI7126392.1 YcxB family protein [Agathobaculum sp.]MDY3712527.1 YcxB family protein [Agathobaculum sp.]
MELHYDITKQDYIDFNLNYYTNNAVVQRSILMTRIASAAIVILGGTMLMYWLQAISPVSIAVYVALAAVCFFGMPWYMKRKLVKNTERILRNANNKQLCGPKTMILREQEFELKGENEDTVYQYAAVQRTASDEGHYYIFVDEFSALIVPFTAFESEQQKQAFYSRITAHITDEALKL